VWSSETIKEQLAKERGMDMYRLYINDVFYGGGQIGTVNALVAYHLKKYEQFKSNEITIKIVKQ